MNEKNIGINFEEKHLTPKNGLFALILNLILIILSVILFVFAIIFIENGKINEATGAVLIIISCIYFSIVGPILFAGVKVLKPNEAYVFTLFGKYYGSIKKEGIYFVNPFVSAASPNKAKSNSQNQSTQRYGNNADINVNISSQNLNNKKISLKTLTLSNEKQKINDSLGNPIIIGIVVIWRVIDPTKAVFNVDDYTDYLSTQCDSALRNIVRLYPYDNFGDDNEKSLRGSSLEIAENLKNEIQSKVTVAGLEIIEARITHLSYSEEIAAAMLQRQQAAAIVDARQLIVEGAVGMVEMALEKLSEKDVVHLDEERKAAMVSNLLVVLCGNRDAQPVVNSGSIY